MRTLTIYEALKLLPKARFQQAVIANVTQITAYQQTFGQSNNMQKEAKEVSFFCSSLVNADFALL